MSEIKPYYGEENQHGQWWDGKSFRKLPNDNDQKGFVQMAFRRIDYLSSLYEKGCHADGCFTCPRCRMTHFLPTNYDLLCDGCVRAELANNSNVEKEILEWKQKTKLHYSGSPQPEIIEREIFREHSQNK